MIADLLIRRAKQTPYIHLDGYMNRWWLVPYAGAGSWGSAGTERAKFWRRPLTWLLQRFDVAIRVHEILRSDRDRAPHDHPWPYLTVILKGGYTEQRYDAGGVLVSTKWHGPGSVLWRPAGSWHRLTLPDGQTATTLFMTGSYRNAWGFNVAGQKVGYREYLGAQPEAF
jgi:hypothetical protein